MKARHGCGLFFFGSDTIISLNKIKDGQHVLYYSDICSGRGVPPRIGNEPILPEIQV